MSQHPKINNRKAAHSQHPESLKLKKKGAGKGGWGNPMDDLKYLTRDRQPSNDPNDPNFDDDLDGALLEEQMVHQESIDTQYNDTNYFQNFQSDVESLSAFKIKVEELVNSYFYDQDEEKFTKSILDLNCPDFFNQVPKVLLWTVIASKKQEHFPATRKLLRHLRTTMTVSKVQLESAFRRLFHRLNELSIINQNAYIILVDFGEFCTARNLMDETFLNTVKKQTEFAKDPQRIERLKNHIKEIIAEFFSSGDIDEAIRCVNEMDTPFYTHEVVKRIISTAFDHQNRERELTSQFLARAVGDGNDYPIPRKTSELGFIILLQRVEDLYKDVPDVLELLSSFIGRAIVDEVLPPAFIDNVDLLQTDMGYTVINHVKHLLSGPRHSEKLLNVWGTNSSKSIDSMKKAIKNIIAEYLISRELDEALTAIQELNIPMFHHEIIKQLIPAVADYIIQPTTFNNGNTTNNNEEPNDYQIPKEIKNKSVQIHLAIDLLATALQHNIITKEQINGGFKRLRDRMDDYKLDSPLIEKYYNVISAQFKHVINDNAENKQDDEERLNKNMRGSAKDVEINDEIKKLTQDCKQLVIEYNNKNNKNCKLIKFEAIQCKSQVVAGIIYYLKIKIDDNDTGFIHITVWRKVDKSLDLLKIEFDKRENDELSFKSKATKKTSRNKPQQQTVRKVGGLKDRSIDELVMNACKSVRKDVAVEAKSNNKDSNFSEFTPIKVKSQVVAGTNLFVKVKVNDNRYLHVRIWCKLDRSIELSKVQWDKNENDEISYF